jgi:hypothetical protein
MFSARDSLTMVFSVGLRKSRSTKLTIPFDNPALSAKTSIEMPWRRRSSRRRRTTPRQIASQVCDSDTLYH